MNFTVLDPHYLLLLLVIPAIIWLFWRATTHLAPFRRGLVLVFRVVMIALVVLSLSGLSLENPTEQVQVMFALDVSDSVNEEGREAGLDYLQRAVKQMKKGDQAGLVVFGAEASVEASLQPAPDIRKISSNVSGHATDISQALGLAMAQFSPGGERRVVLLTDG
ncbi:MAG: vWA domain-containing protein, partial [Candidatus Entotheonellia bacterium]